MSSHLIFLVLYLSLFISASILSVCASVIFSDFPGVFPKAGLNRLLKNCKRNNHRHIRLFTSIFIFTHSSPTAQNSFNLSVPQPFPWHPWLTTTNPTCCAKTWSDFFELLENVSKKTETPSNSTT
jgi:hypothetical protein